MRRRGSSWAGNLQANTLEMSGRHSKTNTVILKEDKVFGPPQTCHVKTANLSQYDEVTAGVYEEIQTPFVLNKNDCHSLKKS